MSERVERIKKKVMAAMKVSPDSDDIEAARAIVSAAAGCPFHVAEIDYPAAASAVLATMHMMREELKPIGRTFTMGVRP